MTAVSNLAAPESPAPTDASPSDQLASRANRLCAALVDGTLACAAIFLVGALVMGGLGAFFEHVRMNDRIATVQLTLCSWMAYPLMNGYLLAKRGQTIGKWLFGIRIVRSDGSAASLRRLLLLRWLPVNLVASLPHAGPWLSFIDPLFIFRTSHRCLHDQVADTIVVRASATPPLW